MLVMVMFASHIPVDTKSITNVESKQPQAYEINNENPYEIKQEIKEGQKVEPVIFEPLKHIKLSRSTYKVTSFIDFGPYKQSFKTFETYMNDFLEDLETEEHIEPLLDKAGVTPRDFTHLEQGSFPRPETTRISEECRLNYECRTVRQFREMRSEAHYLKQLFTTVYHRFLNAIDQMQDEPELETEDREKRAILIQQGQYQDMTEEEAKYLDKILEQIERYDSEIHSTLIRHKRFDIMTWVLGWGVFSNARNIRKIKKNIKTLYLQNVLQDQQIAELASYLNLTATQVQEHTKALYQLDVRLLEFNYTLFQLQSAFYMYRYINYVQQNIRTTITRLTTGILALQNNVEQIYEYMKVLSSHLVNPLVLPPESLRDILLKVQDKMRQHPRLELPYDPLTNIWDYYGVMRVTPIVMEELLTIILTIPLMDKSLQMDVYQVHNLPAIHPGQQIQFTYKLEGKYLAIGQHGLYAALPDEQDIQICLASKGGLCPMNKALYPVEKIEWCIYALFIENTEMIKETCLIETNIREANKAIALGGYMWAISSLVGEKLQIRCLTETHIKQIYPPLQVVYIGNGCEGYSSSIAIPAKTELTSRYDFDERANYFLAFNEKYQQIEQYGPWVHLQINKLTEKQKSRLALKLTKLPPMTYKYLNQHIQAIDENYPWSIHPNILLVLLLLNAVVFLAILACFIWRIIRMKAQLTSFKPMRKVIMGKASQGELNEVKDRLTKVLVSSSILPKNYEQEQMQPSPIPTTSGTVATMGMARPTRLRALPKPPTEDTTEPGAAVYEIVSSLSKEGVDIKRYGKYLQKKFTKNTSAKTAQVTEL